ncbi:UNVERIFIED_CONTAM: hypothetical protein K2H54_057261 [Gekko kuhli]
MGNSGCIFRGGMAPGKGKGHAQGKQPAPKMPNPELVGQDSTDDESDPINVAILAPLDALEKQRGKHALPPMAPDGTKKAKPKAPSAFQAKILACLAMMEDGQGTSSDQGSGQQGDNADDGHQLEVYRGPSSKDDKEGEEAKKWPWWHWGFTFSVSYLQRSLQRIRVTFITRVVGPATWLHMLCCAAV